MADKSSRLILEALGRAAAEPGGVALLATKSDPGLFPPTSIAKAAAERCKDEGYLQVIRSETKGKLVRDVCILTDKGLRHLLHQSSPRQVLEDFVRILEGRQQEIADLAESAKKMQQSLQAVQNAVEQVLPRLHETNQNGTAHSGATMNGVLTRIESRHDVDTLIADIKAKLAEWHAAAGVSQDCPLPELHRRLVSEKPVSIGQFHDCLRQLHDDEQVYLHPWTGPLYALPEPAFALLVGHEIAYYASVR